MRLRSLHQYVLAIVLCLMLLTGTAYGKVEGQCSNCHTMHNSQDNTHMIITPDEDGTGPNPSLTRGSCVGCHTGTNTFEGKQPFVFSTSEPTYGGNTLAGGNFYWATQNDAKGHNVKGIPGMTADGVLTLAPGATGMTAGCDCHKSLYTITEADTGCEGCHREPEHHAPQQAEDTAALAANGYFRFLSGHMTGDDKGVEGIEDDDWEHTNAAGDHNEYLGFAGSHTVGTGGSTGGFYSNGNTMTGFCTGCHGNFHAQKDTNNNWIRHPSDAVIPNSGEYKDYILYDPDVPVARNNLDGLTSPVLKSIVTLDEDMVMCLSCHRAHGSPHDDMLRWDYNTMVAGGGGSGGGCFKCHSGKD